MNLLELKAKTNKSMKFWTEDVPESEKLNPWHYLPKSLDIEASSYALLTYVERGFIEDSIPVLNWLLAQENPFGGFASTRDTVVALNALAKLNNKITPSTNIQVKFAYKKQESNNINVNKDNALIIQKFKVIYINTIDT